ncbi:MAG: peptidoglycan-binding protein [Inquilinus limosus]|uniref:Peptidoglycan-binding protein n=1 Tax=Inquilinus limosus TaxID=171674 RepID=A0A952KPB3_9PROT|nr:peptidoglycan-binding protein [Inquilinus limosus]
MRIARIANSLAVAVALVLAAAAGPARADGLDDFFSGIRRQFEEPARPSRSQSCAQTEAEAHVLATTAESDLGRVRTRIDRIERDAGAGTAHAPIDQATQTAAQAQGLSAKLRRAQAAYRTIIGQCGRPDLQSERLGSLARRLDAEARRANRLADRIASTPTGALPGGPQACPALVDDAQSVQADTTAVIDRIGQRLRQLAGADPLAARTGALAVADDIAEQRQRVDTIDARAATQGPDCAEAAAIRDRAAGDRQSLQALQNQADTLIGPPAPEGAEPALTTAQRRKVQERLAALGHYRSQVDGRFGDGTRRAIALYQRAGGSAATGRLTQAQADALLADPATAPPRPLVQQAAATPAAAAPAAPPAQAAAAPPQTSPAEPAAEPAPATSDPAVVAAAPAASPEPAAAPNAAPKPEPPPATGAPAAAAAAAAAKPEQATASTTTTASVSIPAASAPAVSPSPATGSTPPAPAAEAVPAAPAAPIAPTQPAQPPADPSMVPSARVAAQLMEGLRRWPQPPTVTVAPAAGPAPSDPDPFIALYGRLRGQAANGEMQAVQAGRYELVGMALIEHGAESTQMLDANLLLVQAAQALDARDEARRGLTAAAPLIGRLGSGESRRSRQALEAATAWLGLRIVAADLLEAIAAAGDKPLDGTTADRMSERLDQIEQVMAQAQDGVDELSAQALFLRAAVLAAAGRKPDDAELKAEIDRLLK